MREREKCLKKSLNAIQKINPFLAYQVTAADPSDLEFCWTQQEELNLRRYYDGKHYYYHSPIFALAEAQSWFQGLVLQDATVIFVYGVGLGYYYAAAKAWLKQNPHHSLVFLEEDIGVVHRLCETELGLHLLKDPQVQLLFFRSRLADKALFNEVSWRYFDAPFIASCLALYQEVNPEECLQLLHEISFDIVQKKAFVDEYLQYGAVFYRNFYPNMLELPHAYLGNGLFGKFKNVPAILCGAGPSLNKNIDLLKTLKDRALIFGGSSSLNALIPKGILPHFGVAIDPNSAQVSRVAVAKQHQVPFFYRNRLFHKALLEISGPRLYLTGAGGYETARWFDERLELQETDLDEGNNVVNFCLEIAHALGCNPIILVGVDLAFTNQQHYAEGVIENLHLTQDELKPGEEFESKPLIKEDINGKPVYTLWKWITEAEWIAEYAEKHPETAIINCTEGGLGFKGIVNIPLKEAVEKHMIEEPMELQHIDKEIQQQVLSHIKKEHVIQLMRTLQSSLTACMDLFAQLMEASAALSADIKKGLPFATDLHTPSISLIEDEIESEPAYQYILDIFNQVYIRISSREIQDLQSARKRMSEKKRALKKLELQSRRLIFLRDAARVNYELIQRALAE